MSPRMNWEYKIVKFSVAFSPEGSDIFEEQMDRWGADGWEAVSAWEDADSIVCVIFKRPLAQHESGTAPVTTGSAA